MGAAVEPAVAAGPEAVATADPGTAAVASVVGVAMRVEEGRELPTVPAAGPPVV
ncbi:MAG: hypothetical protein H0U58_01810 [Chloroflexi bacterium]|nr:hypothetical protein [Chloroflexota bacterium]